MKDVEYAALVRRYNRRMLILWCVPPLFLFAGIVCLCVTARSLVFLSFLPVVVFLLVLRYPRRWEQ